MKVAIGLAVGLFLGVFGTLSYMVQPVACEMSLYPRKSLLMRGITDFGVPPQIVRVAKKIEYRGTGTRTLDKVRCYVFTDGEG